MFLQAMAPDMCHTSCSTKKHCTPGPRPNHLDVDNFVVAFSVVVLQQNNPCTNILPFACEVPTVCLARPCVGVARSDERCTAATNSLGYTCGCVGNTIWNPATLTCGESPLMRQPLVKHEMLPVETN